MFCCRKVARSERQSVTQFTYYQWRKEFAGLKGNQVKHLKELEKENGRLMSGRNQQLSASSMRRGRS